MHTPSIRRPASILAAWALLSAAALTAGAANWPTWRGPHGDSTTEDTGFPDRWSAEDGVAWKAPLPGPGNASPIVWEDRVFVTQATEEDHRREVWCFDRATGALAWRAGTTYREEEKTHPTNPYCSASPATDGKRVVATFGSAGVFCFDLDGAELWRRDLGPQHHEWGNASSPVLIGDLCIVYHGPGEGAAMVGLDADSGEVRWRVEDPPIITEGRTDGFRGKEPGIVGSFSTPILADIDGRPQLVMSYPNQVVSLDPATGRRNWWCDGLNPLVYTSPVWDGEHLVAMGGYYGNSVALRPGGAGNLTDNRRLWHKIRHEGGIGSGVIKDGFLFFHNNGGTAFCLDVATGNTRWEEKLKVDGRPIQSWSSMVLAGDRIYLVTQSGDTVVWRASPTFEQIAVNSLDGEKSNGTQAMADGQIFIRTHTHLWCIGDRQGRRG